MKSKLLFSSLILLMSLTIAGCGGGGGKTDPKPEPGGDPVDPGTDPGTEPGGDPIDYGRVYFKSVYIYTDAYGNSFDEVLIEPQFTIPEACKNEVFEYDVADESICYIENDYVYASGVTGSTKVTAKSQHLKGTFIVYSSDKYNNAGAFGTAKSLANKAEKATNQGTTLFVGDSFFEFWRNKTGIDEVFTTAFAGYDVANVGISGTQAREWKSLVKKLIYPYRPANIVLNIGINDVDDNNEDGESTAAYVMSLCNNIWHRLPDCKIYYCSITRCTGYFASKWQFTSVANEFMKANAEANENLNYLDIMGIWGDNYANYLQADGLHPNTAGYEVFKDLIKANVPLASL